MRSIPNAIGGRSLRGGAGSWGVPSFILAKVLSRPCPGATATRVYSTASDLGRGLGRKRAATPRPAAALEAVHPRDHADGLGRGCGVSLLAQAARGARRRVVEAAPQPLGEA